jgi:hypothetical protein
MNQVWKDERHELAEEMVDGWYTKKMEQSVQIQDDLKHHDVFGGAEKLHLTRERKGRSIKR